MLIIHRGDGMTSKTEDRGYCISTIVGRHIKAYRKSMKLTLEEVANRIGYSSQAIHLCENARRMPSQNLLIKLSNVYQVPDELLFKLREDTIIETINTYGDKAPISIKNEYEIMMNATNVNYVNDVSQTVKEALYLGNGEYATEEELKQAKAFILTLRSLNSKT